MTADHIFDAIGEIREDFIDEVEGSLLRPRRRVLRNLVAACLTVFLLALPVSAEVRTGYISNLLMPLYGGAQTELVDSVGVPVNASITINGYTLTADAIIGDRYNLGITYTLRREDGGVLPEGIQFDRIEHNILRGGGGGWYNQKLNEDGTTLVITQSLSSNNRISLFRRKVTVSFTNLVIEDFDANTTTAVQEGTWELTFAVRYKDTTQTIRIGDLEVKSSKGDQFTVHKVQLSPFGVNIKLTVPNAHYGLPLLTGDSSEEEILARQPKQFEFTLRLKDGSLIPIEGGTSSHGSLDKPTHKGSYHAMFDQPVPIENIAALIFCDTEYPLE